MECKTIAPMVVSGRTADGIRWDARMVAFDLTKYAYTHNGENSNYRKGLRWAKRQAHKADRRAKGAMIQQGLDEIQDEIEELAAWSLELERFESTVRTIVLKYDDIMVRAMMKGDQYNVFAALIQNGQLGDFPERDEAVQRIIEKWTPRLME